MQRKEWSRSRVETERSPDNEEEGEIEGLFRKASGLLSQAGYKAGRTHRVQTASYGARRSDVRAPGPIRPNQSLILFPEPSNSHLEEESYHLDRCSASFHYAKIPQNTTHSRIECRRTVHSGQVSERHRRFLSSRDEAARREISPGEKATLNGLFQLWKKEEQGKIGPKVEKRFAIRQKFKLFDRKTNETRIQTSKIAALGLWYVLNSIKTKLNPQLSQAKSRLLAQKSAESHPNSSNSGKKDLKKYLEEVLIGQTQTVKTGKELEYQDLLNLKRKIHWLAYEGVKKFEPKAKIEEIQQWR